MSFKLNVHFIISTSKSNINDRGYLDRVLPMIGNRNMVRKRCDDTLASILSERHHRSIS